MPNRLNVDWAARASMTFQRASLAASRLEVHSGRITGEPPTVVPRRAIFEVGTEHRRLFAPAFATRLKTDKINPALAERRGRALVARSLIDDGGPLFALAWHLDADVRVAPLVLTMAQREVGDDPDPRIVVVRDLAMSAVLDLMFWVADRHRSWAVGRLSVKEARAATSLGSLDFDVEGDPEMEGLVMAHFGDRAAIARQIPSGVTRLRVSP